MTAREIRDAVKGRTLTAELACSRALERLASGDRLNPCISVVAERALARARRLDAADPGDLPLAGVPVAVKDNICTRDVRTTAGSRLLEDYVPPYDATAVERLEAAGAVIVAKTNCDEFAMGSSTEHSAFGPARNPWDESRIAGGSSGGSAVAVATRAVPLALGSETGGSVRQPAALCGVLGLKPTYGRISRYGLLAFASSLDQIGLFGTTAEDVAIGLRVVGGHDPRDPTSARVPLPDVPAETGRLDDFRVGVPRALLQDGVDPGVARAFDDALDVLRSLGATVEEIVLPHAGLSTATYAIVAMAEASSNLARYDGIRYGSRAGGASTLDEVYVRTRARFGAEVKRRIMLGTFVLSAGYYDAYYGRAQRVRRLIRQDYDTAFRSVDVVAMPTSPTTAFPLGERVEDPVNMYLADVFTVGANLAGIPAVSIPCGVAEGLPVGLQLTGPAWSEGTLLRAAGAYAAATPWSAMEPPSRGAPGTRSHPQ